MLIFNLTFAKSSVSKVKNNSIINFSSIKCYNADVDKRKCKTKNITKVVINYNNYVNNNISNPNSFLINR